MHLPFLCLRCLACPSRSNPQVNLDKNPEGPLLDLQVVFLLSTCLGQDNTFFLCCSDLNLPLSQLYSCDTVMCLSLAP